MHVQYITLILSSVSEIDMQTTLKLPPYVTELLFEIETVQICANKEYSRLMMFYLFRAAIFRKLLSRARKVILRDIYHKSTFN